MKRTKLSVIALTLGTLISVCCFAGCGNASISSSTETTAAATTAAPETTAAAKSALIGTWDSQEAAGTSYTFNEDGTGSINVGGTSMPFNYDDKGDSIELSYNGSSEAQTEKYTIERYILALESVEMGGILHYKKSDGTQKTTTQNSAVAQPDSALIGVWKNAEEEATLTFNADGTGNVKDDEVVSNFTFIDNKTSVEMKFDTVDEALSVGYTIQGNTLNMTASDGTVTSFTKK